ncbi:MAG: chemotaxis protein CheD [Clostridium sp.]|uniref:chemotaxis protein CheD n=1 Tax=Clostridium sp. TaxID=1506 RepID=UPI003F3BE610
MVVEQIKVGIADYKIAKAPHKIMTIGLGSCVGISIFDSKHKTVGLVHIMLADSRKFKNIENEVKYADLAIPKVVREMIKGGSLRINLKAKIAGGASMFSFSDTRMISDIGKRNIIAVKEALKKERIDIVAEDIGGNKGRTMVVDTLTGEVTLKVVGVGIKKI